jgi:hypothetical protein
VSATIAQAQARPDQVLSPSMKSSAFFSGSFPSLHRTRPRAGSGRRYATRQLSAKK